MPFPAHMSTHSTDWSAPPRYETRDGSRSCRSNSDTVPSSPHRASEPRYVYYRVYTLDGMLRCKKKHGPSSFIGRIKATSVPPPHTVASLKRALVQAEALPDSTGDLTDLFETRDALAAMVKSARVDISNGDLGATPQTAVALVFLTIPEEPLPAAADDERDDCTDDELSPLYYRLYNQGGEAQCMHAFDASEPALGHVRRESIAPPRNVLAVNRRIARAERKPIYQMADLFTNMTADNAQPSDALVDATCGSSKESPVLIVAPERRPGAQSAVTIALPQGICRSSTTRNILIYVLMTGKSANGTAVQAWTNVPDNDGSFLNQLWLVQPTDNGYYSFRNPRSGTYMDLWGVGNPANSTNIVGHEGPGGPNHNQQWELIQAGEFYSGYVVQRESIHFGNTNPSGSNGTRIFGYQDTAGTSREQDELWKFTLRSVTLSGIMSAPERNQHRLDDMHVISKDHIFLIQPTNLFSNIWRSSSLVSQIHNSVFSNAGDMALSAWVL
ncbi:hypothetical protein B0H13DRAFT_2005473 [Mycena leptocephala]|nr:hypothetical protein B0H13DRAFT_2005473 [Mycena leptocephala]